MSLRASTKRNKTSKAAASASQAPYATTKAISGTNSQGAKITAIRISTHNIAFCIRYPSHSIAAIYHYQEERPKPHVDGVLRVRGRLVQLKDVLAAILDRKNLAFKASRLDLQAAQSPPGKIIADDSLLDSRLSQVPELGRRVFNCEADCLGDICLLKPGICHRNRADTNNFDELRRPTINR